MSTPTHFATEIAQALALRPAAVTAVLELFDQGATIPFVARYRKEATGGLDEVEIQAIREAHQAIQKREDRRTAILSSLDTLGITDPALLDRIRQATTLQALEDLYLPYRPKRRTLAQMAREKGLEPLAQALWEGRPRSATDLATLVPPGMDPVEALEGGRHILAERFSEDPEIRSRLRSHWTQRTVVTAKLNPKASDHPDRATYTAFADHAEALAKAPSHRVLALFRGEDLGILRLSCEPEEAPALDLCLRTADQVHPVPRAGAFAREQRTLALHDAYRRLLSPSLETEVRRAAKERADAEAIQVFAKNLRAILLDSPFGEKAVIALDPGFRTGCKAAVLGPQGQVLATGVIYPVEPHHKTEEARRLLLGCISSHRVAAIAVGNGTAGRETRDFILAQKDISIPCFLVNESGASIYSASEAAREEFPALDLTLRSAISIGRRFMDPLSELVKIEPKALGVGQYQHDVDQDALKRSLDDTVVSCVNQVGVEVNSASAWLLSYVSGLTPRLAKAVVEHRQAQGPFRSRQELLKVKGLGPKTFEQAAGFLRIREAAHPLDASAVHPEAYPAVEALASRLGLSVAALVSNTAVLEKLKPTDVPLVGPATGADILAELAKPGRDPRPSFDSPDYAADIKTFEDLSVGLVLPGIINNVTAFGAFVDLGIHENALVHISQLADHYVSDPHQVVQPGQRVQVKIISLEADRKRIGATLKKSRISTPD